MRCHIVKNAALGCGDPALGCGDPTLGCGDSALERGDPNKGCIKNVLIADLLHRITFIEKAGTGIKRMRDEARGIPDKPRSPKQHYRTTSVGRAVLENTARESSS